MTRKNPVPIFFFSGTGNTAWCASHSAAALSSRGMPCIAVSIEQTGVEAAARLIDEAGMAGIGYPVYGSDLPEPMKDFINALPQEKAAKIGTFVFCTQLAFSGDGARVYRTELRKHGLETRWSAHFLMPNNISVEVFPLHATNDRDKIFRRLEKTEKKINRFADAIIRQRRFSNGGGICSLPLGLIQRAPYRAFFPRLKNDIGFNPELCTRCGRCIRICPVKNLTGSADGFPEAHGSCILCLRCYNFCPTLAIAYLGKLHNPRRGLPYQGPTVGFKPEELIR